MGLDGKLEGATLVLGGRCHDRGPGFRPGTYHHAVEGHPAVVGEVLQHGHEELEAAIPVTQQQHHPDQVHDPHHCTGQIVGHVEDLQGPRGSGLDGRSPND